MESQVKPLAPVQPVTMKTYRLDKRMVGKDARWMPVEVTITKAGDRVTLSERDIARGSDLKQIAQAKLFVAIENE